MGRIINCIFLMIFPLLQCGLPNLDRALEEVSVLNFFTRLFLRDNLYSIGGSVVGLEGNGLRLQLTVIPSGASPGSTGVIENLDVSRVGDFRFPGRFANGNQYVVAVVQQPMAPIQICEVGGGSGVIPSNSVTSVLIQCVTAVEVVQPVFSPPPGEYSAGIAVTITSGTLNSSIYWTLDGSDPNCSGGGSGATYSAPVLVPQPSLPSVRLKAIACLEGRSSNLQVGDYRVTNGILPMPTASLATNPPAPSYIGSQTTTLIVPVSPPGVTLHYTADGSTPTCSSPSTPNPVVLYYSKTLRAISCLNDWTHSNVAEFPYTISGTVAEPTFSHSSGIYDNDVSVVLSVATPGAEIRYELTTDGSDPLDPNCSSSQISGAPILVNRTGTRIKAIGCIAGWTPSPITAVHTYTLQAVVKNLTPIPPLTIASSQTVTAITATSGATIYYRIDGIAPDCTGIGSTTTPPTLIAQSDGTENTVNVRAIACKANYTIGASLGGSYTLTGTLNPPVFSVAGGVYSTAQSVSLTLAPNNPNDANTTIHYTTDGSVPSCASTTYSGTINVSVSQTIRALACRTTPYVWNASIVTDSAYTITGTVANPIFSPTGASYTDTQSVGITSATAGATVRWTSAVGSDPAPPDCSTGNTALPIAITQNDTRIRSIACLTDWTPSSIVSHTYLLQPTTPVPNVLPGTYGLGLTIQFTTSTGATVHTIAGVSPLASNPTCGDPTGDMVLSDGAGSVEVKAIACRAGFQESAIYSGVYTIGSQVPQPSISAPNQNNALTVTPNAFAGSQKICYTTNGLDPNCATTVGGVNDAIGGECALGSMELPVAPNHTIGPLNVTTTAKARSCSAGNNHSTVAQTTLTISGTVGAITPSTAPGTVYNDLTSFNLTATNATHIYFTTNGGNPDCSGVGASLYSGPFLFVPTSPGANVIRAIACAANYVPSVVMEATYTFQVATPAISPAGPLTIPSSQVISATSSTTGLTDFRFTDNGVDPTCATGSVNSLTLTANNTETSYTVKSVACKANYLPSEVSSSGVYTTTGTLPLTVMNPPPGSFYRSTPVLLSPGLGSPSGTFMRYTTNGIDPDCTTVGDLFAGILVLPYSTNLKTISCRTTPFAWNPSAVSGGNYNIAVRSIATGSDHTCAVLTTGNVRCWGYGWYGALGYNSIDNVADGVGLSILASGDVPIASAGVTVVQLVTGFYHTCALLSTGKVRCWGYAEDGELGYNSSIDVGDGYGQSILASGDVPIADVGVKVVQITAGAYHTCALLDTGKIRCWGYNLYGQLGYNNTANVGDGVGLSILSRGDVPVAPVGVKVVQVSAGAFHTCALLDTGKIRCWGFGGDGNLGYNSTANVGDGVGPSILASGDVAVAPAGVNVIQISTGDYHTCALLDNGQIRCWGYGFDGELGYNSTSNVGDGIGMSILTRGDVPVADAGVKVVQVSAGGFHTCGLLDTGNMRCWGFGSDGRLGYNSTATVGDGIGMSILTRGDVPVADAGVKVVQIAARRYHTCALQDSGGFRCWGSGLYGRLGYNNTSNVGNGIGLSILSRGNIPVE